MLISRVVSRRLWKTIREFLFSQRKKKKEKEEKPREREREREREGENEIFELSEKRSC